MKKIINNKLYNTETATELGSWNNGMSNSDSSYVAETLFRKKPESTSYSARADRKRGIAAIVVGIGVAARQSSR